MPFHPPTQELEKNKPTIDSMRGEQTQGREGEYGSVGREEEEEQQQHASDEERKRESRRGQTNPRKKTGGGDEWKRRTKPTGFTTARKSEIRHQGKFGPGLGGAISRREHSS
jgi:hypothetical protein